MGRLARAAAILEAFPRDGSETPPVADVEVIDVDRALLEIRKRLETLEAEHADEEVDFHRPPFPDRWRRFGSAAPHRPVAPEGASTPGVRTVVFTLIGLNSEGLRG